MLPDSLRRAFRAYDDDVDEDAAAAAAAAVDDAVVVVLWPFIEPAGDIPRLTVSVPGLDIRLKRLEYLLGR